MAKADTATDSDIDKVRQMVSDAESESTDLPVLPDDRIETDADNTILPTYEEALEGSAAVAASLGVEFVIYDFEFRAGHIKVNPHDPGETCEWHDGTAHTEREFVVCRIVTAPRVETVGTEMVRHESEYLAFVDGSTGVYANLVKLWQRHGIQKVRCRKGLRVSEYPGPQGGDSKTYYLS
jgi:hypothetical protein